MPAFPEFCLTPDLLLWEMSEKGYSYICPDTFVSDKSLLTRCRLYTASTVFRPHTLYLADSLETWLSITDDLPEHCLFFLVLPEHTLVPKQLPCPLLFSASPLACIHEQLLDIFDSYRTWDEQLKRKILDGISVSDFCDLVFQHLQIPFTVMDAHFRVLARPCQVDGLHSSLYLDTKTGNYYYPQSIITEMNTDPDFQSTLETTAPQWWVISDTETALYRNLRDVQGNFEGRIVFRSAAIKLANCHMHIIEYIARYLEMLFASFHSDSKFFIEHSMSVWMEQYLSTRQLPDNTSHVLQQKKWDVHDQYLCLCLCRFAGEEQHRPEPLEYLFITTLFPESVSCIYQNQYIVLLNMQHSTAHIHDIETLLSPYIREGLLKMGISDPFYDFTKFYEYYFQAHYALHWILQPQQSLWSAPFYTCALSAMLDSLEKTSSSFHLVSGKLDYLESLDQNSHSSLYKTLRVYLESERNIKYTAAYFQVHRTTIYYRLEQITEKLHLNLDDYETRLYLLLSFALKDRLSTL